MLWLFGGLGVAGVFAWILSRRQAGNEADVAHQNLLALLAEQTDTQAQVDDRAIADNLDI